jgi:hypothetical protein
MARQAEFLLMPTIPNNSGRYKHVLGLKAG